MTEQPLCQMRTSNGWLCNQPKGHDGPHAVVYVGTEPIEAEARQQDGSALRSAASHAIQAWHRDTPDDAPNLHRAISELDAALDAVPDPASEGIRAALDRLTDAASVEEEDVSPASHDELVAALNQAGRALAALPPSAPPALDVERLAQSMEVAWPGWLEEAPGTDEARAEMREYAVTIAAEYARLQESER